VETIDGGVTWRTAEERAEYLERQKQLEVERTRRAAEAEAEIKRQAEGRERQKQLEAERTRRLADTEREIKRQAEQRERRKQLEVERKRQAEEDKRRRTDEAKWRDWSASIGRAKFVKAIDGTVYLQGEDGRMMTVKRGRLSPEERLWITYRLWRR
jgi:hypothetical protein